MLIAVVTVGLVAASLLSNVLARQPSSRRRLRRSLRAGERSGEISARIPTSRRPSARATGSVWSPPVRIRRRIAWLSGSLRRGGRCWLRRCGGKPRRTLDARPDTRREHCPCAAPSSSGCAAPDRSIRLCASGGMTGSSMHRTTMNGSSKAGVGVGRHQARGPAQVEVAVGNGGRAHQAKPARSAPRRGCPRWWRCPGSSSDLH